MPDTPFAAALAGLGITQAGFRHAVRRLTGVEPARKKTSRWCTGRPAPPEAMAVIALLAEIPAARRAELTAR